MNSVPFSNVGLGAVPDHVQHLRFILNRLMGRLSLWLCLSIGVFLSGCEQGAITSDQSAIAKIPIRVVVTSQPMLEMAQAIAPESFELIRIVPQGTSSLDWKPNPESVRVLRQAKSVLISGAGYEPWRDRISLPGSRLKDTASGYYDQFIRIPDAIKHQHGPDGSHSHPGTVWATWLDPNLAVAQLSQITTSLVKLAPDEKTSIELESAKLKAKLEDLNAIIGEVAAIPGIAESFVVSDGPYYQYLTERLGCKLTYLHWPLAGELSEQDRLELTTVLSKLPASSGRIFLHGDRKLGDFEAALISAGFRIVSIDLCEQAVDPTVSFVERLRSNLTRLKAAISAK